MSEVIERWKPVPEYGDRYEISESGRVRNSKTGAELTPHPTNPGSPHLIVGLSVKGENGKHKLAKRLVARMVLEAFDSPAPSKSCYAKHKDGNHANCHISNLEWGHRAELMRAALARAKANGSRLGRRPSEKTTANAA